MNSMTLVELTQAYRTSDGKLFEDKIEAMLHQLPVIGKNNKFNACREIVRDKLDGFLYESTDDLITKMEFMLNHPEKARQMGVIAQQYAIDQFSLKKSVEKIEKKSFFLIKMLKF